MAKVKATVSALRQLMEEARAALPAREQASRQLEAAFSQGRIPKRIEVERGLPEIASDKSAIFDYRNFGDDPMAYLAREDIALPVRGASTRELSPFRRPSVNDALVAGMQHGSKRGGHLWYNTDPIYQFAERYAPEADVGEFLNLGAPLSIQTRVPEEIKQTAFVNYFRKKHGRMPTPDELRASGLAGGSKDYEDVLRWSRQAAEEGLPEVKRTGLGELAGKAKIIPYQQARTGNAYNAVIDSIMLDLYGLPRGLKTPQKGVAELGTKMLAERAGMMPRDAQAAMWTGTQGDTLPYAGWLDRLVSSSAEDIEKNKIEHMIDVLTGSDYIRSGPRKFGPGGAVKAIAKPARGALSQLASFMQRKLWEAEEFGGMGDVSIASNEFMKDPVLMKHYLASQVPEKWRSAILEGSYPRGARQSGSGRDVMFLRNPGNPQEDAVVKIAKRPRALSEQALEGEPTLASKGLMPPVLYRTPDDEVVIVPRMPTDAFSQKSLAKFMDPMAQRFQDMIERKAPFPTPYPREWHREDPMLREMMQERGLDPFLDWELLGGDFFTRKGFPQGQWGPDPRIQSTLLKPRRGENFVLLDAGALKPDLTQIKERNPSVLKPYVDIVRKRANWLSSPEVERMYDEPPQGALPFKRGGIVENLRAARKALAAGGAVRNWFRGVKGVSSHAERLINQLKGRQSDAAKQWVDTVFANQLYRKPEELVMSQPGHPPESAIEEMISKLSVAELPRSYFNTQGHMDEVVKNAPPWFRKLYEQDLPRVQSQRNYDLGRARVHSGADVLEPPDSRYASSVESAGEDLRKYKAAKDAMLKDLEEKYQRRHAPPVQIHDLQWWAADAFGDRFRPVMDWFAAGADNIPPERWNRISVKQAEQSAKKWHEAMQKKAQEQVLHGLEDQTIKKYPTGEKWVEFRKGDEMPAQLVGRALGHCYQHPGTCKSYLDEGGTLVTLIDKKGKPLVTVEKTKLEGREVQMRRLPGEQTKFEMQELPSRYEVGQIRGAGNEAPGDEAVPFIQDLMTQIDPKDISEAEHARMARFQGKYVPLDQLPEGGEISREGFAEGGLVRKRSPFTRLDRLSLEHDGFMDEEIEALGQFASLLGESGDDVE